MTLGLEIVKFLLEQHEDNVPIVQEWIDKWFWRGNSPAFNCRHDDGLHAAKQSDVLKEAGKFI
jgi:hypothetical protein